MSGGGREAHSGQARPHLVEVLAEAQDAAGGAHEAGLALTERLAGMGPEREHGLVMAALRGAEARVEDRHAGAHRGGAATASGALLRDAAALYGPTELVAPGCDVARATPALLV